MIRSKNRESGSLGAKRARVVQALTGIILSSVGLFMASSDWSWVLLFIGGCLLVDYVWGSA